jgi:hypothetical protein
MTWLASLLIAYLATSACLNQKHSVGRAKLFKQLAAYREKVFHFHTSADGGEDLSVEARNFRSQMPAGHVRREDPLA